MTEPKEVTYEAEVIEDARTGEEIPVGIQKVQSNTLATSLDLTKVGTTVLDEKAESVLAEPLNEKDVQIRPDGLVYLPWTWYADRLNRAFGRLGWGLVPQSGPMTKDMGNMTLVVWGHWLVVRGIPVGFEMGETAYRPDNHQMSFGDAAAGAKSNSLARNCKMLGMSLELWSQEWVSAWRDKYAETYESKGKTLWRKKKANGNGHQPQQTEKQATKAAEEVKASPAEPTGETRYKLSDLKTVKMIGRIATDTGKKNSEVAVFLGKLEKGSSYSLSEIVEKLKEGEKNVT